MRVAVSFVANAVSLLAGSSIDDCSGNREALLLHDKAERVVDVIPQARITLRFGRRGRSRRSWGSGWCRWPRTSHVLRPHPTNLVILSSNVIEAAVRGFIHQSKSRSPRKVSKGHARR